jgi:hypothetical protein
LGLVYLPPAQGGGTIAVFDDVHEWYDDTQAAALKSWSRDSPGLADEFYTNVIVKHDVAYWRRFCDELNARAASAKEEPKSRSPAPKSEKPP